MRLRCCGHGRPCGASRWTHNAATNGRSCAFGPWELLCAGRTRTAKSPRDSFLRIHLGAGGLATVLSSSLALRLAEAVGRGEGGTGQHRGTGLITRLS